MTKIDAKAKKSKKNQINDNVNAYFGLGENQMIPDALKDTDSTTKQPNKTLCGHKKAIREIAYSVEYKTLISCGFDFEIFVWNPDLEESIINLKGHENPLIGVNCISS